MKRISFSENNKKLVPQLERKFQLICDRASSVAKDRQDLVRTSLLKLPRDQAIPISKAEDVERQRFLLIELMEKCPNETHKQLAEWPHSRALYYRRRKEIIPEMLPAVS